MTHHADLSRPGQRFSTGLSTLFLILLLAGCNEGHSMGANENIGNEGGASSHTLTVSSGAGQGQVASAGVSIAAGSASAVGGCVPPATVHTVAKGQSDFTYWSYDNGNYLVQVNAYYPMPSTVTSFTMWSNSPSCWGFTQAEAIEPPITENEFWNAPEVTRGWTMNSGAVADLGNLGNWTTSHGMGIQVDALTKAHVKWEMTIPSVVNRATSTTSKWDALMDVYFHNTANPGAFGRDASGDVAIDLQIYQMVMDFHAGGQPNWYAYILNPSKNHVFKKTIGGVTYHGAINNQDPHTSALGSWKCKGGSEMQIALFVAPTPGTGSGSYLWGATSALHDLGGIIKWLNQSSPTDDDGKALYDNCGGSIRAGATVTSPLIPSSMYLTSINAGYEVNQAPVNDASFKITNFWVAVQGEADGN